MSILFDILGVVLAESLLNVKVNVETNNNAQNKPDLNSILSSINSNEKKIIEIISRFYSIIGNNPPYTDDIKPIICSSEEINENTLKLLYIYNKQLLENIKTIKRILSVFLEDHSKSGSSNWSMWNNQLRMQYRDIAIYFDNLTDSFLTSNFDLNELNNKINNLKALQEHYN